MILAILLAACPALSDAPSPGSCSFDDAGMPSCAPGEVDAKFATMPDDEVTEMLCAPGGTQADRCHPDKAMRKAIFLAYGLHWPPAGDYTDTEVDHRLEESLGGAQTYKNLWPQKAPDYHQKDLVEADLHRQVCKGALSLGAARSILLGDWRSYYRALKAKAKP